MSWLNFFAAAFSRKYLLLYSFVIFSISCHFTAISVVTRSNLLLKWLSISDYVSLLLFFRRTHYGLAIYVNSISMIVLSQLSTLHDRIQ